MRSLVSLTASRHNRRRCYDDELHFSMGADGGHKPGGNTMFDNVSLIDLGP
jgi:hypothetical protein